MHYNKSNSKILERLCEVVENPKDFRNDRKCKAFIDIISDESNPFAIVFEAID